MGKTAMAAATAALILGAAPQGAWAACSNSSLNNTFSVSFSGFTGNLVPLSASSQLVFDGGGGITGSLTQSNGGIVSRGLTLTGSYSVSSNCTGFATLDISNGGHVNFDFTVGRKGQSFVGVQTNRGSTVLVTGTRGDK
jgi:hypothetical protein